MWLFLFAACAQTVDGTLPEGVWGDDTFVMRVDAAGATTLDRSCGSADLGTPTATDGVIHVDFEWVTRPGDPPDSGTDLTTDATLDATVTTAKVTGTMTESGQTTDIDLRAGKEPTLYECP